MYGRSPRMLMPTIRCAEWDCERHTNDPRRAVRDRGWAQDAAGQLWCPQHLRRRQPAPSVPQAPCAGCGGSGISAVEIGPREGIRRERCTLCQP
jgi:hypothetical protein